MESVFVQESEIESLDFGSGGLRADWLADSTARWSPNASGRYQCPGASPTALRQEGQ